MRKALLIISLILNTSKTYCQQGEPFRPDLKLCFGKNCNTWITREEILSNLAIKLQPINHIFILDSFEIGLIAKRGDYRGPFKSNGMNFTAIQKDAIQKTRTSDALHIEIFARYSTTSRPTKIGFTKYIEEPKNP